MSEVPPDGVHAMVPVEKMDPSARRLRDFYAMKPGAPLFQDEFGFMEGLRERWQSEGLPKGTDFRKEFGWDGPVKHALWGLGWCEAAFVPEFEDKVLEDRGEHEVYQDRSGRGVLVFKGRRSGFMPEYVSHPVKDMKTWQENCKWRMQLGTPERWANFDKTMADARDAAARGHWISQRLVGGYMYLRSLVGPVEIMYATYDMPDVIHDCMKTWLELADDVIARHQQRVTLDEIFLAEDICYNHGLLISPEMAKEFLLPYYQQLIANVRSRQIDKSRHMYVQIDTDGWATPSIPMYRESISMEVMSPFECGSGCDVVKIGQEFPYLRMSGGIDKRILAQGKDAIDRHLDYILPAMRKRGGYYATCDHMVPLEVSLENYRHYRKRCLEFAS